MEWNTVYLVHLKCFVFEVEITCLLSSTSNPNGLNSDSGNSIPPYKCWYLITLQHTSNDNRYTSKTDDDVYDDN